MLFTIRLAMLFAAFSLLSCTPSEPQNMPEAQSERQQTKVTYSEPEGWIKSNQDQITSFKPEEGDVSLTVVYVPDANSAEAAADIAWTKLLPDFKRPVRVNSPRDITGGWNDKRSIEYVTSVSEKVIVYAYTHELDSQWYVVLLEGNSGTVNKRGAAIGEMLDSFKVEGYKPEDLSAKTPKQLAEKDVLQLVAFIRSSAETLNVPGVGIALSQNGRVLFQGGVGLANIDKNQPVTEDTLFMVASNTKGMVTLLLAKLVEMGKLSWQDRVIDHFPAFRLGDEETTKSVLIEHLVCACTGLPRRDLGWIFNNDLQTPASAVFDDLASTKPTSEFGKIFQYSNEMAAAAGYVAGYVLYPDMEIGAAFDKAMREYIFEPLEMDSTLFSIQDAMATVHALPYADSLEGNISPIEQTAQRGFNHTVFPYRPAGAAWSSPADMIKYVQNELDEGVNAEGVQVFAKAPMLARRKPYVSTGDDESYGMGLSTEKIAGIYAVSHGGSIAGYQSNFYAFPAANVGLVVLTNSDEGWPLPSRSARKLIEILYEADAVAEKQIAVTAERKQLNRKTQQQEFQYPGDPAILNGLATTYQNPVLGEVRIYQEDGDVFLDPGLWRTQLGTKQNSDGTSSVVAIAPFMLGLEFLIEKKNDKRALTISYAQDSHTFVEM